MTLHQSSFGSRGKDNTKSSIYAPQQSGGTPIGDLKACSSYASEFLGDRRYEAYWYCFHSSERTAISVFGTEQDRPTSHTRHPLFSLLQLAIRLGTSTATSANVAKRLYLLWVSRSFQQQRIEKIPNTLPHVGENIWERTKTRRRKGW